MPGCHLLGCLSPFNVTFITTKKMIFKSEQSEECMYNLALYDKAWP